LLLAKGSQIILTTNIWTGAGLVNRSMENVYDIIFEEQGPPLLLAAVFIKFNAYKGLTIITSKRDKVILIVPIKYS
jgi:hypothetical protein